MRYVNRNAAATPSYFGSPVWSRHWSGVRDYFSQADRRISQERAPLASSAVSDPEVHQTLAELFDGRCAFCERQVATEVRHFRPAADASPKKKGGFSHVYYAWLCDLWENLYPVCTDCWEGVSTHFPVTGTRARVPTSGDFMRPSAGDLELARELYLATVKGERPQLLDPCRDRKLEKHLAFEHDGLALPFRNSSRGKATIERFRLNRPELVRVRAEYFAVKLGDLLAWAHSDASQPPWGGNDGPPPMPGAWGLLWKVIRKEMAASVTSADVSNDESLFTEVGARHDRAAIVDRAVALPASAPLASVDVIGTEHRVPSIPPVKRVTITNFKTIARLQLSIPTDARPIARGSSQFAAPCLLILGENAAGKSSVLEALAMALTTKQLREELSLDGTKLILNAAYLGKVGGKSRRTAKVDVEFGDGSQRSLSIGSSGYSTSGNASQPLVLAYGPYRHFLSRPEKPSPIRSLFESNWVLGNPEEWLLRLNEDDFSAVVRTLRAILSMEQDFNVIEREEGGCWMVLPAEGRSDLVLRAPLHAVSSGYRAVLAMACDILQQLKAAYRTDRSFSFASARAIVLIDEVEAHLHPRLKLQIMRGLREALPSVTFIVTSHDPLCLRGMRENEVMVVQRVPSSGQLPVAVEAMSSLPNISQLTVEQLLTSDFFSLLSTDDPIEERKLAQIGDLMAKRISGSIEEAELKILENLERDLSHALPIGGSEVHRLVQEAVEEFLSKRRSTAGAERAELRRTTRMRILSALEGI